MPDQVLHFIRCFEQVHFLSKLDAILYKISFFLEFEFQISNFLDLFPHLFLWTELCDSLVVLEYRFENTFIIFQTIIG